MVFTQNEGSRVEDGVEAPGKRSPSSFSSGHTIILALCLHQVFYNRQTSIIPN